MRIFMGLREIAGVYYHLSKGFESLNIPHSQIDLSDHSFGYPQKTQNFCIRFDKWAYRFHERSFFIFKPLSFFLKQMARLFLFFWAVTKHDVFLFGFGESFFKGRDLFWLKLLGRKVFFHFHGSDARPPYMNGKWIEAARLHPGYDVLALKKRSEALFYNIQRIEKYADGIVNIDAQSLFFKKKYVQNYCMGLPYHMNDIEPDWNVKPKKMLRVLHAPSHSTAKGTYEILAMLDELKEEGLEFELIRLEGVPNHKVAEELKICDMVVDQLYGDRIMAGLITEAAAMGKPSIIGGYYKPYIETGYAHKDFLPPVVFCDPIDMKSEIRNMMINHQFRHSLGKKAYQFIKAHRDAKVVAQKYLDFFQNKLPDWYYADPKDNQYVFGNGVTKKELRKVWRTYIDQLGEEALFLNLHPHLKEKIVSFATKQSW